MRSRLQPLLRKENHMLYLQLVTHAAPAFLPISVRNGLFARGRSLFLLAARLPNQPNCSLKRREGGIYRSLTMTKRTKHS